MRTLRALSVVIGVIAVNAGNAGNAGASTFHLAPSPSGDDTANLEAAIVAAWAAGPGSTVQLGAGTFRISRSIIVQAPALTIRGAGKDRTTILADAALAGGVYPNVTEQQRAMIEMPLAMPFIFVFLVDEGLVGSWSLRDLTLGVSGRTAPHFDPNAGGETERFFSLVWVVGSNGFWRNSVGQTPTDLGRLDDEHRVLSTVRFAAENVFFDGRNRQAGAPDVRNAFGLEGGFVLSHMEGDVEVIDWLFKPINAAIEFTSCSFADFPGQAGIFAPNVIGRDDAAWILGPDAAEGAVIVRDSDFVRTLLPVVVFDYSDTRVVVEGSSFRDSAVAVLFSQDFQPIEFDWIGYPAHEPAALLVADSRFESSGFAHLIVEEWGRRRTSRARIVDNRFLLAGEAQAAIRFFGYQDAAVRDNRFGGHGFAGVHAFAATGIVLGENDFCALDAEAAVVLAGGSELSTSDDRCIDVFTEPQPGP
jgi:hypothetical protein